MLNFGDFLRSPAALGLAQGLLAGSQPSMTQPSSFGGALAQGLGLANQYQMAAQQDAYKRQQDALNNQRLQEQLGLSKEELGLRREKQAQDMLLSQLQMQNLNREQKLKEQQHSILQKALMGTTEDAGDGSFSKEQRRRASILAATGDMEGAAKILAEKSEIKPQDEPTRTFITQNQMVSQAVDNVIPQVEDLIKSDVPFQGIGTGTVFSPAKQKAYQARVASITDQLMAAYNLPKSNESLKITRELVEKGFNEGDKAYRERLHELIKELQKRKQSASEITSVGAKESPYSQSDLEHTAKIHGISIEEVKKRLTTRKK